jgi:hypothetical protein
LTTNQAAKNQTQDGATLAGCLSPVQESTATTMVTALRWTVLATPVSTLGSITSFQLAMVGYVSTTLERFLLTSVEDLPW